MGWKMKFLDALTRKLAKWMYWTAGLAIVLMMLLTCADIFLRLCVTLLHHYGWKFLGPLRPIPGTYELVCYLGAVAASFAMAHTSIENGHVAVSLVVRLFPQRVQGIIAVFTDSLGFYLFCMISWRSILYAEDLKRSGEVSLTLQLPYYPFVYGVGFAAAAVCLVLLTDFFKNLNKAIGK
jgi:TRAP-type C4-dicarboxylate transport system permease small subunit